MRQHGYIALSRRILDHPLVGAQKPYSYLAAWVWLLLNAAWAPRRVTVSNGRAREIVSLARGQLSHSLSYMASAFGWSDKAVRTFLKRLEKDGQIAVQRDGLQTVITVCNYDRYQAPNSYTDGQKDRQETIKGREEEEGKKGTNRLPRTKAEPHGFAEWYNLYPRKTARRAAAQAYGKLVPGEISANALTGRTMAFAAQWAKRPKAEIKYCPYPATWLNRGDWQDDNLACLVTDPVQNQMPVEFTEDDWINALAMHQAGEPWPEKHWGPEPGKVGCRVPGHLFRTPRPSASQHDGEADAA